MFQPGSTMSHDPELLPHGAETVLPHLCICVPDDPNIPSNARLRSITAYFLRRRRRSVTPSRLYRSRSGSSVTGSESKCFLSIMKNRLSAWCQCRSYCAELVLWRRCHRVRLTFLRFFQQKRISISLPTGARSQSVLTSSGNAGCDQLTVSHPPSLPQSRHSPRPAQCRRQSAPS